MPSNNETSPVINDPFSSPKDIQQSPQSARDDSDAARISWAGESSQQQEERQIDSTENNNNNNNSQHNGADHNQQGNSNKRNDQQNSDEDPSAKQSWYQRMVERYSSLELDNKGSVARDHLALERTFLAWLRTSLSFASIGIAVTQLFRLNSAIPSAHGNSSSSSSSSISSSSSSSSSLLEILLAPPPLSTSSNTNNGTTRFRNIGKPLGATFVGIGILTLVIGFHRYFESQYWIVRGKFPASRGSVALVSFVAAGLVIASFVVVLVVAPNATEM